MKLLLHVVSWIRLVSACAICFAHLLHTSVLQDTLNPLKEAIKAGQALPLSELPILNLIPLPGPIKKSLDTIEIADPQLVFDTAATSAELSGKALLFGQSVVIKIRMAYGEQGAGADEPPFVKDIKPKPNVDMKAVAADLKELARRTTEDAAPAAKTSVNPKPGGPTISGQKAYDAQKQMAPQKQVNIPVKRLDEVKQKVATAKDKINGLTGQAAGTIKATTTAAKIKLAPAVKKQLEKINFAMFIGIPKITFGTLDKSLSFLDILQLSNLAFVVASGDYFDKTWGRTFYKGLNLLGTARLTGPFEKVNEIIGADLTEITLHGIIDPTLFGSSLTAELPGKIKLGKSLETSGLILRVELVQAAIPISVSILTGINIRVPNQEQPLGFRSGITYVPPTELVLGGWMEGMWKNPFGVPYLSIGEMGVQAGTDIQSAVETLGILSLSRIGVRGRMGWGSKFVEMAMSISLAASRPDLMLLGSFEGGLYLHEFVEGAAKIIDEGAKQAGQNIGLEGKVKGNVPKLGFTYAKLYISPIDVSLAGSYYKQGITLAGGIDILGVTAEMRFAVDTKKYVIEALGSMSTIDLGFFKITGAGQDKVRGTEDDGPIISFKAKPSMPFIEFFIDGRAELNKNILGGAYGDTRLSFSTKGVELWFKTQLFNQFMTHLELSAPSFFKPKDWKVIGKFEQSALDAWAKLLEQGAQEIAKEAENNIPKAKAKIDEAQKKLDAINKEKEKIRQENERNMASAIKGMQSKLDALKREKDDLEKQIEKCKGKLPKEAQEEASKKAARVQEKKLTAADIAAQTKVLKDQGLNQIQIDRIVQKLWAQKATEELQAIEAGMVARKAFESQTTLKAVKQYVQEQFKYLDQVPKELNAQVEYVTNQQIQQGMPAQYKDVVREMIWVAYYQGKSPQTILAKNPKDAEIVHISRFIEFANSTKNNLLAKTTGKSSVLIPIRVVLFEEMLRAVLQKLNLGYNAQANNQLSTTVKDYESRLKAQIPKPVSIPTPPSPQKQMESKSKT